MCAGAQFDFVFADAQACASTIENRHPSEISFRHFADISTHSLVAVSAYEFEYVYFTGSKTNTLLGIKIARCANNRNTPFSNRNLGGHNANFCVSRRGTPTAWSLSPRHCTVQGARWFRESAKESPSRSRGELHGASRLFQSRCRSGW